MTNGRTRIARWLRRVAVVALATTIALVWVVLGPISELYFAAAIAVSYLLVWGIILLLSRQSVAETAIGFVLTSATLGVLSLMLEVTAAAGIVDFQALIGAPITHQIRRPINQPDPELLWRRKPYLVLEGTRTAGNISHSQCLPPSAPRPYRLAYDGNGFRNPRDLQRADIAVVGDSYIEGVDVLEDDLITSVLARKTGLTVANLGLSAYGPVQQLITVRRYALPLKPRAVVWALYERNDLMDIIDYYKLRDEVRAAWRKAIDRSFTKATFNRLFHLYRGCARLWGGPYKRFGTMHDTEGRPVTLHFLGPPRVLDEIHQAALVQLRHIVGEMQQATRAADAATLVVFVPDKFRVYKDLLEYAPDSDCRTWRLNDLPEQFAEIVREVAPDFAYLDLTPTFMEEARKRRILYLSDDTHWNEDGHHVAAEAIRDQLAAMDIVPAAR